MLHLSEAVAQTTQKYGALTVGGIIPAGDLGALGLGHGRQIRVSFGDSSHHHHSSGHCIVYAIASSESSRRPPCCDYRRAGCFGQRADTPRAKNALLLLGETRSARQVICRRPECCLRLTHLINEVPHHSNNGLPSHGDGHSPDDRGIESTGIRWRFLGERLDVFNIEFEQFLSQPQRGRLDLQWIRPLIEPQIHTQAHQIATHAPSHRDNGPVVVLSTGMSLRRAASRYCLRRATSVSELDGPGVLARQTRGTSDNTVVDIGRGAQYPPQLFCELVRRFEVDEMTHPVQWPPRDRTASVLLAA